MESEFLSWLRLRLDGLRQEPLGLSDDAAILPVPAGGALAMTTDMLMDQVDFDLGRCDPRQAGRKSLAVNLSDLAAMAARPRAALVSLALPRAGGLDLARQLYEGMIPLAEQYECALAGGDTNSWGGGLAVSVMAVGEVCGRGPLLRSGARPGDSLLVTGSFGGSILGRHFDFQPRVREALLLNERYGLHAGIDVSDGLSLDLARLLQASGCGAVIDLDSIPIHDHARRLARDSGGQTSALEHALSDGEDFELILAAPPEEAARMLAEQPLDAGLRQIGVCIAEVGLWQTAGPNGERVPLTPRGYEHRLSEPT